MAVIDVSDSGLHPATLRPESTGTHQCPDRPPPDEFDEAPDTAVDLIPLDQRIQASVAQHVLFEVVDRLTKKSLRAIDELYRQAWRELFEVECPTRMEELTQLSDWQMRMLNSRVVHLRRAGAF